MTDQDRMPFGKYKGQRMEEVPASYLLWLWNEGVSHPGVSEYIKESMSALQVECPDMSDMGDDFREHREALKERKNLEGIDCPGCIKDHPKRNPTRLLPGWICKVCGFRREAK